jgi:UDP-glucoronosyl and UDP-glucosyl transferase
MIGHTTDFHKEESRTIDGYLQAWLDGAGEEDQSPVVYVAMGTLSILPEATLRALSEAMRESKIARFVWVVAENQQALLPPEIVSYSRSWRESWNNSFSAAEGAARPTATAGDILLVSWVPQLAVLKHRNVKIFWSHGGMNGVAEGTYARSPFLCTPLFSDQPDNCQHIEDRGMGLRLNTNQVSPSAVEEALTALLSRRSDFVRGLETAWRANVAAGGITRAVQIIESTAALGYEGSRAMFVPRHLQHSEADGTIKNQLQFLVEKYDIDIIAGVILLLAVAWLAKQACCRCCCCSCCCCCRSEGKVKGREEKIMKTD